jgi:hypothetical protein
MTNISNHAGQFSLKYPSDWGSFNCDPDVASSARGFSPNAVFGPEFKGAHDSCWPGESPPTAWIVEFPSSTPQSSRPGQYVGRVSGTTPITVDGVTGTRETAAYDASHSMNGKGATEVVYAFTTAGRTYVAYYTRVAGQADLSNMFDAIVQKTLRFAP